MWVFAEHGAMEICRPRRGTELTGSAAYRSASLLSGSCKAAGISRSGDGKGQAIIARGKDIPPAAGSG
jgi:hypothetical protein